MMENGKKQNNLDIEGFFLAIAVLFMAGSTIVKKIGWERIIYEVKIALTSLAIVITFGLTIYFLRHKIFLLINKISKRFSKCEIIELGEDKSEEQYEESIEFEDIEIDEDLFNPSVHPTKTKKKKKIKKPLKKKIPEPKEESQKEIIVNVDESKNYFRKENLNEYEINHLVICDYTESKNYDIITNKVKTFLLLTRERGLYGVDKNNL